jgi:hypothetical protein
MTTVDNLLLKITTSSNPLLADKISAKEARILYSLANLVNTHLFITENQSRLLVRILQENSKKLLDFSDDINQVLMEPKWSKPFRRIEEVKKLYIAENGDDGLCLIIEFTSNQKIRSVLQEISKKCENLIVDSHGKKYIAELTEKNIIVLVDSLTPFNFEIDDTIKSHYDTIKSWSDIQVRDQFLISNIEHKNFQKAITDDLGIETAIDQNIILDRSMRYQYFTDTAKNHGETLTEVIANRSKTKLWVDNKQHSLSDVLASLIDLKRLPVMIIFDTLVDSKYLENLKILDNALKNVGITDHVGVYFRLANDDSGKQFNQLIASNSYNQPLDSNTNVAVVMSGKIPKFFLKTAWKPMSVIALNTRMGLRHGKTAVYSNCCDCIIEWAEQPTLLEQTRIIK